jgi:hypothetical protein
MTGVKPKLTPFAAFGLTLVMILAAVFHIGRGEYNFLPVNFVLGGVAAFVCEAHRTRVDQFLPRTYRDRGSRCSGPRRFCSVWYKLAHTH